MWAVIFICGQLSCGGGGGSLPWLVLVFRCHVTVSDVAPGFPVSKESGGRGVFTHLLVVVAASDVGAHCVSLGTHCHWCHSWVVCCCCLVMWCRPAIVVAWSSSVVVVVVVSHHCHRSWLLTWHSCVIWMVYQHVQVVVSGGRWCGDDGWVSWVGVMSGHHEWGRWWWWWWWWLRKEVVVC